MPTKASPSGGTASPSAAPQMCSGVWGRQLHGGRLFWFCRKEMVSPSSRPAAQPDEVPRWGVQGDGHGVGNLAPAHGTELRRDAASTFPCQFCIQSGGGVVSLWTKPTGNHTTLSSSTGKSHQPSVGTSPTQRGGLDREDTNPTSLEGVGLGAAAIDLRTNRAIAEMPPPGKHPLVGDTVAERVTATKCPPESPQLQGASSPIPSGVFTAAAPLAVPAWGDSPSTQSWRPDGRIRRGAHLLGLGVNLPLHPASSPCFLCSTVQPPVGNSRLLLLQSGRQGEGTGRLTLSTSSREQCHPKYPPSAPSLFPGLESLPFAMPEEGQAAPHSAQRPAKPGGRGIHCGSNHPP